MNALGQEARTLINSVSTHDEPTRTDKARVRARLAAELGAAAFATVALSSASVATLATSSAAEAALTAASSGATHGARWPLLNKLALSVATLGVVAGALWFADGGNERATKQMQSRAETAKVAPAPEAQAPSLDSRSRAELSATPAAESATAESGAAHGTAREASQLKRSEQARKSKPLVAEATPEAAPAAGTLGLELKLLREAQAALRAGTPERALALAAEHRANYPEGVMKEERLGIEALAGCALGRDYKAQAEAFLRGATGSPLRARVQKACGITP